MRLIALLLVLLGGATLAHAQLPPGLVPDTGMPLSQTSIPDNGGKPIGEDPELAKAREAEYAQRRAAYLALLRDASAKAAQAKMQADTERLARQAAGQ